MVISRLFDKGTLTANRRLLLIMVLILTLSIRLALNIRSLHRPPRSDEVQYDAIAYNVVSGHGYSWGNPPKPTAIRVPMTPLFVAGVYALVGHHPGDVRLVQAFMDTINCLMVFLLALLIGAGWGPGLLAAFAYAWHPQFLDIENRLFSDTLFIMFFLASVLLFMWESERRSLKLLGLSAFLLSLSILTRPTTVLFPLVIVILLYAQHRQWGKPWRFRAVLYLAVVGLTIAPWAIRNAIVFRSFIPLTTYAGLSFRWSVSPITWNPKTGLDMGIPKDVMAKAAEMDEVHACTYLLQDGKRVVRDDPGAWMVLCGKKTLNLWFRIYRTRWPIAGRVVLALINLVILALTWIGAKAIKSRFAVTFLLWTFLYYTVFHVVLTSAELRYSTPALACMLPFAGLGLISLSRRATSKSTEG